MTDIIGKKTIENAAEMVSAQLHEYQKEINEAYLACDDALTVSVPIKFKPENSATRIETSIKFYTGQIKDSAVRHVDEKQQDLFEQQDEARARYREILFRNFDDLRRIIEAMGPLFVYRWPNEIKYRTFSLPQPTEQPTKKPATSAKVVTMTVKHGRRKAQPGKRVAARK